MTRMDLTLTDPWWCTAKDGSHTDCQSAGGVMTRMDLTLTVRALVM